MPDSASTNHATLALPKHTTALLAPSRCADVGLTPPRDEKVAQLFAMCDDDNSGQLDLAEFEAFFKVVLRDAAKRAAKLGKMDSQKKLAAQK